MITSKLLQNTINQLFRPVESWFNSSFGSRYNPLYNLGGLSFFFFWIASFSGLYLYIFFETSITGAYDSIEVMTNEQWYLGGIMRSFHRYGSDAMVVTVLIHLLREFSKNRFQNARWFSWVTGVIILWLLYATGISGYWLVWDEIAQFISILTAKLLDGLPFFNQAMARNFLNQASINDRFFSLLAFMHIAIPLLLLLGMWIHIQRISVAKSNPPRFLAAGTLLALVVLSLLKPAVSMAPANLDKVVSNVSLDWFYLTIYPLIDHWSVAYVWLLLFGGTTVLLVVPLLFREEKPPVAVVNLENCNGCDRCFDDCPYGAIVMSPRSDGLPFEHEAVVNPDQCVSCGLCVGACPSATPFRRVQELIAGIELPDYPTRQLRAQIIEAAENLEGKTRLIVFGCEQGMDISSLNSSDTTVLTLPCAGFLPPPFIDFILSRKMAEGVVLTGCKDGDCYHRFGIDWTEQRIQRQRDPQLRKRVPVEKIKRIWTGQNGLNQTMKEVAVFRSELELMLKESHRGRATDHIQEESREQETDQ